MTTKHQHRQAYGDLPEAAEVRPGSYKVRVETIYDLMKTSENRSKASEDRARHTQDPQKAYEVPGTRC